MSDDQLRREFEQFAMRYFEAIAYESASPSGYASHLMNGSSPEELQQVMELLDRAIDPAHHNDWLEADWTEVARRFGYYFKGDIRAHLGEMRAQLA
jgi:hypothetical protein